MRYDRDCSCNRRGARNCVVVRKALSQGLKSGRETRKGHPQFGRHLCSEKEERERGGRGERCARGGLTPTTDIGRQSKGFDRTFVCKYTLRPCSATMLTTPCPRTRVPYRSSAASLQSWKKRKQAGGSVEDSTRWQVCASVIWISYEWITKSFSLPSFLPSFFVFFSSPIVTLFAKILPFFYSLLSLFPFFLFFFYSSKLKGLHTVQLREIPDFSGKVKQRSGPPVEAVLD